MPFPAFQLGIRAAAKKRLHAIEAAQTIFGNPSDVNILRAMLDEAANG